MDSQVDLDTFSDSPLNGEREQKPVSEFRAQILLLAEEYERIHDENRSLCWEVAQLRNALGTDLPKGALQALSSVGNGVKPHSASPLRPWNRAGPAKAAHLPHRKVHISDGHEVDLAGVPEAPTARSAIEVLPPLPTDPFATAEVLSERAPSGWVQSHTEAAVRAKLDLNPQEHGHSRLPKFLFTDTAPLAAHVERFESESDCDEIELQLSERAESELGLQDAVMRRLESQRSSLRGGMCESTGVFPKWFDPGDIEEDEGLPSQSIAPMQFCMENLQESDKCMLLPFGRRRLIWDFIAFLCIMVELWMTPFQLIYCENFDTPASMDYVSYTITGFFAIDIVLNFNTGYLEGDVTIMQRKLSFLAYMKAWFWVDMLATVPWDLILMSLGGIMTIGKMGKASKTLKAVRYLKMVRLIKLLRTMKQAGNMSQYSKKLSALATYLKRPFQMIIFLVLFSHIHGIVYAAVQPEEWLATETTAEAMERYIQSCWWVFAMLSCGVPPGALNDGSVSISVVWFLDMIIIFERFMIMLLVAERVMYGSLFYIDEARNSNQRQDMLKHLRENHVSMRTQLQVLFSLTETNKAQKKRKHFSDLMNNDLPRELQRTICDEMWSSKLMSFGLIRQVAQWHTGFTKELAQMAREEVFASRSVVFKLGDASQVAYNIVTGVIAISTSTAERAVPDFTKGMWVGESALVSTVLRRSSTCISRQITSCMSVHGDHFQQLLSRLGLTKGFQDFCAEHLWRGICGRCGQLGDHFSDTCGAEMRRSLLFSADSSLKTNVRSSMTMVQGLAPKRKMSALSRMTEVFGMRSVHERDSVETEQQESKTHGKSKCRELQIFLDEKGVGWLQPMLQEINILSLAALECTKEEELRQYFARINQDLSPKLFEAISPESIQNFRENNSRKAFRALFHEVSRLHHLIFLSHYKLEAGTEAALMRNELEMAIHQDAGNVGNSFDEPVFLDSDNLVSLEDLQRRVRNTHNLVLLLTSGVLKRPWVLVEIMTARREGVRILLVNVSKPGGSFEFPDDTFFSSLSTFVDKDAVDLIKRCGFSMSEMEEALRAVFQQIAVPYSPHKASSIRKAEIAGVLKQCRLKTEGRQAPLQGRQSQCEPPRSSSSGGSRGSGSSYG